MRRRISTSPSRARSPSAARCSSRSTCRRWPCSTRSAPSRLIARLAEAGATLVLPRREAPGLALGLGGVGVAARRSHHALCRASRAAGHRAAAHRAAWTRRMSRRSGGCSSRSPPGMSPSAARHAAAGKRRRRAHRVQDRHELRLSRRLGDRLRRQAHHRRVGRAAGRRAGRRALSGAPRRRRSCSMPSPRCAAASSRCRRRRPARSIATTAKLPPPLQRFRRTPCTAASFTPPAAYRVSAKRSEPRAVGDAGETPDPFPIKIAGGTPPLDGAAERHAARRQERRRTLFFEPEGPGFVRLTVTDAAGAADSVLVRLQ